MTRPDISIIIPAFNEAERLGESLRSVIRYAENHHPSAEIIVVDDGSSDDTKIVANQVFSGDKRSVSTKVISYGENRGKGFAVRAGLSAATGEICIFSDADLSTPISELPKLTEPIKNGTADVAIGSRALDRSLIGTHQSWTREQGGKIFNLVVRLFTGLPFWDTQCGFKAFRGDLLPPILKSAQIDRFGFDVELLFIAHLAKLKIKEIPVRWNHHEGSKINVLQDSRKMFREVLEIRLNLRKGIYRDAINQINVLNPESLQIGGTTSNAKRLETNSSATIGEISGDNVT